MNKFNESVQIEETTEFKDNEVMNELNNEQQFTSMAHKRRVERLQNDNIQVGDKVKWSHAFQALNQQCFGRVVNAHVKVMGNPCFLIQSSIDNRQVMVSKDKVSKV